jgi:hypothetical protein
MRRHLMPNAPQVRYVAVVKLTRITDTPAQMNVRGYPEGGAPAKREVEHFTVPAVRAAELDRLREKINQYLELVTDEDFGEERVTRGD